MQTWSGPRQKRKDKSQRQLQAGFGACARKPAHEKRRSKQQSVRKQPNKKRLTNTIREPLIHSFQYRLDRAKANHPHIARKSK